MVDFGFFQPFFSDHLCSFVFFSIEEDVSDGVAITGATLLSSSVSVFQTFVSGVFGSDVSSGVSAPLSQSGRSSCVSGVTEASGVVTGFS